MQEVIIKICEWETNLRELEKHESAQVLNPMIKVALLTEICPGEIRDILFQNMESTKPGTEKDAAAEAEAARGASDEVGARACRPLAGGQPVYLWAMVSVMQNDLLSHFLQHYAALGVDLARRATFVLHVPPGGGFDASANATAR